MLKYIAGFLGIVAIVVGLFIGIYQIKRWWNYNMGYEAMVVETTCKMVDHKYLTQYGIDKCK